MPKTTQAEKEAEARLFDAEYLARGYPRDDLIRWRVLPIRYVNEDIQNRWRGWCMAKGIDDAY